MATVKTDSKLDTPRILSRRNGCPVLVLAAGIRGLVAGVIISREQAEHHRGDDKDSGEEYPGKH